MQIRAIKTFASKTHGLVREGLVLTVADDYGRQLVANSLAVVVSLPQAPRTVAHQEAPRTAEGKHQASDTDTAVMPGAGEVKPLSAPPAARRSRRRTSIIVGGEPGSSS